jgi:hypothetical protein
MFKNKNYSNIIHLLTNYHNCLFSSCAAADDGEDAGAGLAAEGQEPIDAQQ